MTTTAQNIENYTYGDIQIMMDFTLIRATANRASKKARFGMKKIFAYKFSSVERMQNYVIQFVEMMDKKKANLLAKKAAIITAKAEFVNPYVKGSILYHTYGYDQTNIHYYEVVEAKAKSIVVREVSQTRNDNGNFSGTCMPVAGDFIGAAETRIIQVRVYDEKPVYSIKKLYAWDGNAKYYSSGH
jgi:hypothetical protein